MKSSRPILMLISANTEWRAVTAKVHPLETAQTPFGEWFRWIELDSRQVIFMQGGWGKISAAASTQYAIDRWKPDLIVNLGTCGGLAGRAQKGEILLVNSTLVYDIVEQMGDPVEALDHYSVTLDLSWLKEPYPHQVRRVKMLSADRDILPSDVEYLNTRYGGIAADWETGAIAWVASRNQVRCLILRGVTDLVEVNGGEAYGKFEVFVEETARVMDRLMDQLPDWFASIEWE